MRINHKLINKTALAKQIGLKPHRIGNKLKCVYATDFTTEEEAKIKEAFEDLFCYLFEVDEIIFEDNMAKGIIL